MLPTGAWRARSTEVGGVVDGVLPPPAGGETAGAGTGVGGPAEVGGPGSTLVAGGRTAPGTPAGMEADGIAGVVTAGWPGDPPCPTGAGPPNGPNEPGRTFEVGPCWGTGSRPLTVLAGS